MKTLKRLFRILQIRKKNGEDHVGQLNHKTEYCEENDETAAIGNMCQSHRIQDSIREIFLICMEPFL